MIPDDAQTYMLGSIVQKPLRQFRTRAAPVDEIVADEYSVCTGVGDDIRLVRATVGQAVVRIDLVPQARAFVLAVDVVPKGLLLAAPQIGFLVLKPGISPVLVERQRARNAHRVDNEPLALVFLRSCSYYPIAGLRDASEPRLAGG